jgi:DNA-binding winged helix-turn-helix (wHTH) protein/Tol biopolymer transport system component
MAAQPQSPARLAFGPFGVDAVGGELRKGGVRVRLSSQPFQILLVLLAHPGELVTREQLRGQVWSEGTFVDFEHGLNTAINKLRRALGDAAENPRYIETQPGRGYRFIGTLERPEAAPIPFVPAAPIRETRRRRWLLAAGATLVLAGIAGAWWAGGAGRSVEPAKFHRLTFRRGVIQGARFTPGGRSAIYAASWEGQPVELFSTQFSGPESRPLGVTSTGLLSIAPNGEMAVSTNCQVSLFFSLGTLAQMPLAGGAPREILENARFADWSRDGTQLAVSLPRGNGKGNRLEFPIGKVIFEASGTGWPGNPKVSPKGDLVAFADHDYFGSDGFVAVVDLRGRKTTLTPRFGSLEGLAWSPGGKEIWFTASTKGDGGLQLYAVNLSGKMRSVARAPANLKLQDIATDGRLLLTKDEERFDVYFLGPGESVPRELTWLDWATAPRLSSDGKTLLTNESGEGAGGNSVIYVRGTDGSPAARLGDQLTGHAISPDGKWVAASPDVRPHLVLLPMKAGAPVAIETGSLNLVPAGQVPFVRWFPDSQRILFPAIEEGHKIRTFVQDIKGGRPRAITPEGISGHLLTADGASLLVFDSELKAFLYPLDGGVPKPLPFLTREYNPLGFTADGRGLYALKRGQRPPNVWRLDLATGRSEMWREIPVTDPAGLIQTSAIQITPDGKSLAYLVARSLSELYLVEGLK